MSALKPLFYDGIDPITLNRFESIVINLSTLQRESVSRSGQADPRRDYDDEFGYPKNDWSAQDYHDLIAYEPTAGIVNCLFPLESWKVSPSLYENEDSDTATEFEAAWDELSKSLTLEDSHYAEEAGSRIWSTLLTADILSGEGRFGTILIGLADGKGLSEPASFDKKGQKLTFLRPFPEYLSRVTQFEQDRNNKRYGLPNQYAMQFSDPLDVGQKEINEPSTTEYVHWSRVVHIADIWHTASSSPVFAIPRCKPVRNPILDIRKVRGASAEMYYKGALPGHSFKTHPQLGADVDVDVDALRNMYEEYINGLQRGLFTSGMDVDSLEPQVSSPKEQILAQIEAIAMRLRVPKRKLIGNETGERATEVDTKEWAGTVGSRNHRYVTPGLITPLVNRLINLGVLPKPNKGFKVDWPELYSMSEKEKADILLTRTQAYGQYVSTGMEQVIPQLDYMTRFDDMEEEEAQSIIEAAEELQTEMDEEAKASINAK